MITQARPEDYPEIKRLLDAANDYVESQTGGPRLWTAMEYVYEKLKIQVQAGECYVSRDANSKIAAAIAFNEEPGPWQDYPDNEQALFVYKWMKNPKLAAKADPSDLLRFVCEQAESRHKTLLRIDTIAELTGLIKYYERLGFHEAGKFFYSASSGREGILMEAKVADVQEALS